MAEDMWIVKYISHDRARSSPESDLIDRDYISYFDIKERIKELGFQKDSVYYMSKGQMMVELKDDAAVMNMLDEFSVAKEVCLHIYKTRGAEKEKGGTEQQPAHAAPNVVTIDPIGESSGSLKQHIKEPVNAIPVDSEEDYADDDYGNCHLFSDVEYESAGEYWKEFMGQFHDDDTSSSDEDFDIGAETERLRKLYAEKKEKELAEKGVYSEDEVEDLFDVTEGLDGFDIDEIGIIGQSQMEKEMDWAKAEDARQKKEKADKKNAIAKAKQKKKKKVGNDMDLSDPPSSDGGNDPLGYSDEEEDESALVLFQGRKRARPKRMLEPRMEFDDVYLDDADKMPEQLIKGMCFKDVKQFRQALQSFHILQGRSFAFVKNKMHKIRVKCKEENCTFQLFASKISGEPTFMIREDVEAHSCGVNREDSRLRSKWIASHYENQFRVDPNWNLVAFMQTIKRDFNFEITKRMAYRAKAHAQKKVLGDQDKQYLRIRDYLQTLLIKNPGSKAIVDVEPRLEQHLNPRFSGMFVSFYAQIQGFLAGCRPFFGLDGCFVKLANGAQVLAASARDGNNNMFPLAFGVVNKEDTDNWTWFLQALESAIGQGEKHGGWTIMSDRQKGLLAAVEAVFPGCEHRYCKRHVLANFSSAGFKGAIYKEYFDKIVYACTLSEYNVAMEQLKAYDEEAWKWVSKIPKQHISRHAFSTRSKTDLVVNNLSEVFNKYILDYRDKPIVTMMELIRTRLMTRLCLKRSGAESCGWNITPVVSEKLEWGKSKARYCTAYQCGVGIWQVNYSDKTYEVNLINRTCGCFKFQLNGIPCEHACEAIFRAKEKPEAYVHEFFKLETYKKAFEHMIYPVPHESEWVKTASEDIDPPGYTIPVGRPKKNRRKGADEDGPSFARAKKGTVQCSNCKGIGHNMRGCKKPLRPYLALRSRKHVPLPNVTQENRAPDAAAPNGSANDAGRGRTSAPMPNAAEESRAPDVSVPNGTANDAGRGRPPAGRGKAPARRGGANATDVAPKPAGRGPNATAAAPKPVGRGTKSAPKPVGRGRGTANVSAPKHVGRGKATANVAAPKPAGRGANTVPKPAGRGKATAKVAAPKPVGRGANYVPTAAGSGKNAGTKPAGRGNNVAPNVAGTSSAPNVVGASATGKRATYENDFRQNVSYGRSSRGRIYSWFTIAANAAARDRAAAARDRGAEE